MQLVRSISHLTVCKHSKLPRWSDLVGETALMSVTQYCIPLSPDRVGALGRTWTSSGQPAIGWLVVVFRVVTGGI
eukprot:3921815-Pleurochrysis_carterae.AAC.8